jgi:hypothetical protein
MLCIGFLGYELFRRDGAPFRDAARLESSNRFDRPYQQSCKPFTGTESRHDWCNIGNRPSSSPTIVVIGDSFANAYAPMMAALLDDVKTSAPRAVFAQLGRQQCPLLLDYGPPFCREITKRAMAYIKDNQSVRTIVLASNWPLYEQGKDFHWSGYREKHGAIAAALDRTVDALRRMGKDPVVFLAPPVGSRPKTCVVRPLRLTGEDHCALTREAAAKNDGLYREGFIPHLKALSIPYFDPFAYLCDDVMCKVTDAGRILSSDGHHLSVQGGDFLAKVAKQELAGMLKLGPL